MQLLLNFLRTPTRAGAAPVWAALDNAQRVEVVATLARLIAKMAAARSKDRGTADPESSDE